MSEDFSYTGTGTLEVLLDAVNYNKFLETELIKFISPQKETIDFGAGIGEFANRVRKNGITVSCVELDTNHKSHLEKNGFATYSTIISCPQVSRIYSLNVLEHIEDDMHTLHDIKNALNDNGKLFLYVPAFMCLYTEFDKNIGHFRRYRLSDLTKKLSRSGYQIDRAEYVDSIGFICWFIMGKLPGSKTSINPLMVKIFDRLIFPVSRITDKFCNKIFGKNLLIIASKPYKMPIQTDSK